MLLNHEQIAKEMSDEAARLKGVADRLENAARLLGGNVVTMPHKRRRMSASARRKISVAQRARWRKQKQAA